MIGMGSPANLPQSLSFHNGVVFPETKAKDLPFSGLSLRHWMEATGMELEPEPEPELGCGEIKGQIA